MHVPEVLILVDFSGLGDVKFERRDALRDGPGW